MAPELRWLRPEDPPDSFPDVRDALADPDGLLAVGGDLSVERLLAAYRRGIFPWYQHGQPILWWYPDPRAVLFPAEFHVSRSLRRTLRSGAFVYSIDQAFEQVIAGCASDRDRAGTWITEDMRAAYVEMHRCGHAHSVESWHDGTLSGGLYGISIGGIFFGESMFTRRADASKVALTALARRCRHLGVQLIDCQLPSAHLTSLGAQQIPGADFQQLLRRLTVFSAPRDWAQEPATTATLCESNAH